MSNAKPLLTDKIEESFRKQFLKAHNAKIVDPKKSGLYKLLAKRFLRKCGVNKINEYLDRYSFTRKNKIYSTYFYDLNLLKRIRILTHEIQHVIDRIKLSKYYLSKNYRVQCEARAFCAEMEIYYWITGSLLSPVERANSLSTYMVGQRGIDYCETTLRAYIPIIKQGIILQKSSDSAIDILKLQVD